MASASRLVRPALRAAAGLGAVSAAGYSYSYTDAKDMWSFMGLNGEAARNGAASKALLAEKYELHRELGRGQYATVNSATSRTTGDQVAVKLIRKSKATMHRLRRDFEREVAMMRKVFWHPFIVNLLEAFETPSYFVLVLDHAIGGELFNRIVERGSYSEAEASTLMRGVVSAVDHCHQRGVIHQDLKPENILLSSPGSDVDVKLCDFGHATSFAPVIGRVLRGPPQNVMEEGGTVSYAAPEMLKGFGLHGPKVDEWALGVILFILLGGYHPFDPHCSGSEEDIRQAILKGQVEFDDPSWDHVSNSAKDLIRRLLTVDPATRMSAREALEHPWVQGDEAPAQPLPGSLQRLAEYNAARKAWRFAALCDGLREWGSVDDESQDWSNESTLVDAFNRIDRDGEGAVGPEELRKFFRGIKGRALSAAEVDQMVHTADLDHDGKITLEEFMAIVR